MKSNWYSKNSSNMSYKIKTLVVALSLTLIGGDLFCQSSFLATNLGEPVNSKYPEINPILSPDGKTLYFSRANHPQNTWGGKNSQDIWYTTLNDDGSWAEPQRLPREVNIGRYNAIFGILNDGKTFLINGHYTPNGKLWLERGLSFIKMNDDGSWSKPITLHVNAYSRMNKGRSSTAYITSDGKYIFLSFSKRSGGKKDKLYMSELKGRDRYSKPKRLKFEGNKLGKSYESPFLTSDGNALYFSCNVNGNYNIYYSNRTDESKRKWSVPVPLSDTVNRSDWENYYHLNAKGSWAYFCSNYNSTGKADIYRIKIFEENPFIKISGLVLNKADEKLMLSDTSYTIMVNDSVPANLTIDRASASYELKLPFGGKYNIKPEMKDWVGVTDSLDASTIKEYTEINKNLYFEPIPFVKVYGKIINTRTDLPISPESKYEILINGQKNDSVKYAKEITQYEVLLPLGAKYAINFKHPYFTAKPDTVDVSDTKWYTEKNVNFMVTSVPWIEVNGIALDNVTFTPITGDSDSKLIVNGNVVDSIKIDPVSGEFTIRLPFGKKYSTSVSSSHYNPLNNEIDLTGYVEYAKVKHEVYAERKDANMAILSGKIINLKTDQPIESDVHVNLKVNGTETRGFNYDSTTASYTLKLPVGASYDILPSVKNFYNKYEQVDLTKARKGAKIAKNFYVTPIEVGQSVNIDFIYFASGKAMLKPQSFKSLNALVDFLNEYPNVKVEIGGHTDNVGNVAINQRISEARAKAVAQYVISMGIPESRITSKGYNFSKPKASNATSAGRAKNRRVEFTIIGI